MAREGEQVLAFTIPIFEPLPSQVGGGVQDNQLAFELLAGL